MPGNENDLRYVPLNRSFRELSSYASESDDSDLAKAFYVTEAIYWPQLLQDYRIIILSEAGSGKTEEFGAIAKQLRSEGKAAFFLRLENIPGHFGSAFDVGSEEEFQSWMASGMEGWLFLDSVDEARLRSPKDFELALRILHGKLKLVYDRTHVFLSGRRGAWRPKTDLDRAKEFLPITAITKVAQEPIEDGDIDESELLDDLLNGELDDDAIADEAAATSPIKAAEKSTAPFRVVTLQDLSREQVETFAGARGVNDTKAFADAIEMADAWSFAAHPQDLDDLIASWMKRGEIGTRRTIMEDGVERRLRERDEDRAQAMPLTSDRALRGAQLLAAATTLGRNPYIQVPDGADGLAGIPVEQVLDWPPDEIKALLQRPIFDGEIYGSVRFHHRSVREYLTAEWLREMLLHPASRRAIEDMFFRTQYGVEVIVPMMRPILPWIALHDDRIRERVHRLAPEVLFEAGDPTALPIEMRRSLLEGVVEDLVPGRSPSAPTDWSSVRRFANADLTEDIRRLLREHAKDQEAASFLSRMVWLGRIKGALPEVMQQALMPEAGKYQRTTAIRAVGAIGSDEDLRNLREAIAGEPKSPDREILDELCDTLKGSEEEVDWLLRVTGKTQAIAKHTVDHFRDGLTKFVERMPIEQVPRLLNGLYQLIDAPPYVDRRHSRVSKHFSWVLEPAASAVVRLIEVRDPAVFSEPALAVLGQLPTADRFDTDIRELKADLTKVVPEWTDLNRALFWSEVARAREENDVTGMGRVTRTWQAFGFQAFWKFGAADFDYFLEQIDQRNLPDDRLVALSGAMQAYVEGGRAPAALKRLKKAASSSSEMAEELERFLHPHKEDSELARQNQKWKKQDQARARREKANLQKSREYISQHLDTLRDPGFPDPNDVSKTQWYLHHHVRNKSEQKGKWTSGDWRSLIPDFGEEIARAYRDGAVLHAHRANPKLRSEGAEPNTTTASTILGLTGLAIEAREVPGWAKTISAERAERAWRFAMHELNGFPDWFPSLYASHADLLARRLMEEVAYEVANEPDEGMSYIISDLSWSGNWSWSELGPPILDLLKSAEPRSAETLNKLMRIVLGSGVPDKEIASLAKRRAEAPDTAHRVQWYAVWTGIDAEAAIPAFAAYLEQQSQNRRSVDEAMSYATHLFGDRHSDFPIGRTSFQEPRYLEQLYVLFHKHIHRSEDINRPSGEAYSPTLRDRAQYARDSIFNLLNGIAGKEAFVAMSNIAAGEQNPDTQRWIAHRAHQRAEQDSDMGAWTPAQVREFNDEQERTPRNHRELADLAVNHLLDLKDDLENGDTSIAGVLLTIGEEEVMRNFLVDKLRSMASGRYGIAQEEELADEKRTDFRFHGVGIEAPVPTELKIADKWSTNRLFERLENQLTGDYLRDRHNSRGIFLLVYRGVGRKSWKLADGSSVDFEGIVAALQAHWLTLSPRYPKVEEIRVIGIDLTKRTQ